MLFIYHNYRYAKALIKLSITYRSYC